MKVHQAKFEIDKGDNKFNQENTVQSRNIKTNYSHTIFMCKSISLRLKTGCCFSSRMIMISPGWIPGSWSPSLVNVIFWPSFIPLSMWTSRILRSLTVFLPWQVLQRSFSKTNKQKHSVPSRTLYSQVLKAFLYSLKIGGALGIGEGKMDPCLVILWKEDALRVGCFILSQGRSTALVVIKCFRIRWVYVPTHWVPV